MEPAQGPNGGARSGTDRTAEEAGELLTALADEDCRTLLQAAAGEALSTSELSESCGLPLSTTYRKIDMLTEAGLLERRIRLCSSGKHTNEYVRCIDNLSLSLTGDHIDIKVSRRSDAEGSTAESAVLAGAD